MLNDHQVLAKTPKPCPRICLPDPGPDDREAADVVEVTLNEVKTEQQKFEVICRSLAVTPDEFMALQYEKDLADITCVCRHGYFKPDKSWVSGAEVRAGLAPPKPDTWD